MFAKDSRACSIQQFICIFLVETPLEIPTGNVASSSPGNQESAPESVEEEIDSIKKQLN